MRQTLFKKDGFRLVKASETEQEDGTWTDAECVIFEKETGQGCVSRVVVPWTWTDLRDFVMEVEKALYR